MLTSQDIHWAAGFLDGEGYFSRPSRQTPRITATQKDSWPVLKLQAIFGGSVYQQKSNPNGKYADSVYHVWHLTGHRAAGLMMTLFGLMSPRRQDRIEAALTKWKTQVFNNLGRYQRDKTHCKRGHEFTPENTYAKHGIHRQCRTCQRALSAAWYQKQKVLDPINR